MILFPQVTDRILPTKKLIELAGIATLIFNP